MGELNIQLSEAQDQEIKKRATALNLKPESIVSDAVADVLNQTVGDGKDWFFLLGAPIRKRHKDPYRLALTSRFEDKKAGVDYLHRILDRQINKARALLTYNALLFAAMHATLRAGTPHDQDIVFPPFSKLALLLSLLSCLPLLFLFYLSWGTAQNLSTDDRDFLASLVVLRRRTYLLTTSLYATLIATLITLWLVVG